MQPIITMQFGSHLYGTNTPASDLDVKAVHLPTQDEILLQRIKGVRSTTTKADATQKNGAGDVDTESFALNKFLQLASQGQTVVVDMLFAPPVFWTQDAHPIWHRIIANRHRLLTRESKSFVGYCRTQANKYGIRGSRVAAARAARDLLAPLVEQWGGDKLSDLAVTIGGMVEEHPHMAVVNIEGQAGPVLHWEVCNKKMPFTATIKSAHDIMDRVVAEYGHRALQAEKNEGVDWKALSHAVRIAQQAVELLSTGHVTFPRPNAEHLLAIKTGALEYQVVAAEIDQLLLDVEAAAAVSTLPPKVDADWIESLVRAAHFNVVTKVV